MSQTEFKPGKWLPYGRHWVDDEDIAAVTEVLRGDWLTTGPVLEQFEVAFAGAVGAKHAVACSSGTAALHLVSMAINLRAGDLVAVPSMTFLATATAAHFTGADILFLDVDPDTGLLQPDILQQAIDAAGGALKAVYVVHLNGQTAPMEKIANIAEANGITVIEDACHALGTSYRASAATEQRVGDCRFSKAAIFSFHPVKTITTGEGGAVVTNDAGLAKRLSELRNHGMVREPALLKNPGVANNGQGAANPWYYEMQSPGLNYRLSDIQCALGLSQLKKLPDFSQRRKILMGRYDKALSDLVPVVRPVTRVKDCSPVLHLYPVLIDFSAAGTDRATVMQALKTAGIGTQVHFCPVHTQPYYRQLYGNQILPGADAYYQRVLSLPFFPAMTVADVDRVVAALRAALQL